MRMVADVPLCDETTTNGVPPTSLPKSRTTVAGVAVEFVVRVVEPVPMSALALVTVPLVLVMATALTLSLVGAGTRLCQLGLDGHVGSAAIASCAGSIAAITMP